MARIEARSDALDIRERDLEAREDALRSVQDAAVRRFCDSVVELKHRVDAFEQRRIADALAALPNPDAAPDDGDLEVKPAKTELETVLAHGDQNPGDLPSELKAGAPAPLGSYPTLGREPPQVPQPTAISFDDATPAFVCGRDRRAWKRQQRKRTW
jgi:hypothetical protein